MLPQKYDGLALKPSDIRRSLGQAETPVASFTPHIPTPRCNSRVRHILDKVACRRALEFMELGSDDYFED